MGPCPEPEPLPGSQNQCKRRAAKDLKSRGDVLIARGRTACEKRFTGLVLILQEYFRSGFHKVSVRGFHNGLGFRVSDSGFRVWGFVFGVRSV